MSIRINGSALAAAGLEFIRRDQFGAGAGVFNEFSQAHATIEVGNGADHRFPLCLRPCEPDGILKFTHRNIYCRFHASNLGRIGRMLNGALSCGTPECVCWQGGRRSCTHATLPPSGYCRRGRQATIGGPEQLVAECPGLASAVGVGGSAHQTVDPTAGQPEDRGPVCDHSKSATRGHGRTRAASFSGPRGGRLRTTSRPGVNPIPPRRRLKRRTATRPRSTARTAPRGSRSPTTCCATRRR